MSPGIQYFQCSEHAVWFLHPFHHPKEGYDDPEHPGERTVNADYIRSRLGQS